VIVLDHNIPKNEAKRLRRCRVHFQQVGFEVGRPEWDDQQEILRYLHRAKHVTFFSRDLGFFRPRLCHKNYCLVVITVPVLETALYVRRLLRHQRFNTRAKRQGKVIRISTAKIVWWQLGERRQLSLDWQQNPTIRRAP
jgi:hypothetical protein